MKSWKKIFAVIYAGQAFSIVGSAAAQFAIIWWLTAQTGSAVMLMLASIVSLLPNMILGPFAGVWIDRCSRKRIMIAADGLVALSSIALAAAFWIWQSPSTGIVFAMLFVRGIGNTFHSPAMQAAISMFAPTDQLTKVGGWSSLITSLSNMLGPALGAGLLAVLPIAPILLIDVAGALIASLCLLFVSLPEAAGSREKVQLIADLRQGFAAVRNNKPLVAISFPFVFASLFLIPLSSLYPLLVYSHYMGGAAQNALVELLFSVGMFSVSLIMGIWGSCRRRFLMISGSIFILGMASVGGGLLPAQGFPFFLLCVFLMGAAVTVFNVLIVTYVQESTPPAMSGKILSLLTAVGTWVTPVGMLLAGVLSERISVAGLFIGAGLLIAADGILCWLRSKKYDSVQNDASGNDF